MPNQTAIRVHAKQTLEFEITNHDEEWISDYSADVGGMDGKYLECTTLEAEVTDHDTGNVITVDRAELIAIFGDQAVCDAEEDLAEERSD